MGTIEDRVDTLFRDGQRWSKIRELLDLNRHEIYHSLRTEIAIRFGAAIVAAYEDGLGSRQIEKKLDLRRQLSCSGAEADYVVKRHLLSLPTRQFQQTNQRRLKKVGNVYRFVDIEVDQRLVADYHHKGYRVSELANMMNLSVSEVRKMLGI